MGFIYDIVCTDFIFFNCNGEKSGGPHNAFLDFFHSNHIGMGVWKWSFSFNALWYDDNFPGKERIHKKEEIKEEKEKKAKEEKITGNTT